MRHISLFAGIGGFDLGFERAGFTTVGQCEIDPHAVSVLKRHWPDVPLHGDITTLKGSAFGPAEVVTWGSPCQDLSLAGRRAGLKGERSGLFIEGIRFIRELREATNGEYPRFSVWENVPGAFSSNAGRDFRAVLEAFLEAEVPMPRSGKWANAGVVRGNGREVAWRVLDSQHFGVAQRRRRVFVVADFGGCRAAEILFEPQSVPGHPAKGRSPGEGITGALTGGAGSSSAGNPDDNRAQAGFLVPVENDTAPTVLAGGLQVAPFDLAQVTSPHNRSKVEFGAPANPLTASGFSDPCVALAGSGHLPRVMPTMRSGGANDTKSKGQVSGDTRDEYIVPVLGISQELDAEEELIGTLKRDSPTGGGSKPVVAVAPTVAASWGHHGHSSPRGDGADPIAPAAIAPTDTHPTPNAAHGGKDAGPAGLVPVAFAENSRSELRLEGGDGQRTGALSTGGGKPGQGQPMVAFAMRGRNEGNVPEVAGDVANALRGASGGSTRDMVATPYAVRRLTPRETERLQGMPDDWTELGHYYEGFDRERLWNAKTRTRPKGEEAEVIVRKIADTQRYRLIGNAVSVPVAEWIAKRLAQTLTRPENPLDGPRFSEGQR